MKLKVGYNTAVLDVDKGVDATKDDIQILYNDWPYGIDKSIVHLVVWTKFAIEVDPVTTDMTPESRKHVNDWVEKTFRSQVPHVIWFRNWSALKSVHTVEHFHVMLHNPDVEFIRRITGNDVPMSEKVEL